MADDTAAGRVKTRFSRGMTWCRWLIDILLIAGVIVSVIFEPFSIAVHSIIGLIFVSAGGCRSSCPGACRSRSCCSLW
jgi:hypothetical protein